MASFDVKSLFTFIPVDLALTISKERLQQDQTLSERNNTSVSNIMKVLDFVLTATSNVMVTITSRAFDVQWVHPSVLCWPIL